MNQELRKSFAELRSKCNTSEKRKAYNKLVSTFAKSKADYIKLQDVISEDKISSAELKMIKEKLGMAGIILIPINKIEVPLSKYPKLTDEQRVYVFIGEMLNSGKIVMISGSEPMVAMKKSDFTEYFRKSDVNEGEEVEIEE